MMKLEMKRNHLGSYVTASIIFGIVLIGFMYFVAYVAQVENEPDFQTYPNIFLFTTIVSMIVFSVLSSVMYSRFVIEEYSGTRLVLLFSYPVNRKKVLLAKVGIVVLFTTVAMIICNIPAVLIFSLTESFIPIVSDTLSIGLLMSIIKMILVLSISVNGICIIAMRIGFVKKSIPTTMVTSFILSAVYANAMIGSFGNDAILFSLLTLVVAVSTFILWELMNKVNSMEID
ncbi:ABC transporter permease [Paenibacillus sp. J45TS6]|uniref:ABC transporter permease n=1 Tax=Paenibacillus sp. J45TS6 TaxID=2807196 RepID=UPI0020C023C0|nr:ABC transporter permease [Paenibacillus sp. J45TS6]